MNLEERTALVQWMRENGVLKFADNGIVVELGDAPKSAPTPPAPKTPAEIQTAYNAQRDRQNAILFAHSSMKPKRRTP